MDAAKRRLWLEKDQGMAKDKIVAASCTVKVDLALSASVNLVMLNLRDGSSITDEGIQPCKLQPITRRIFRTSSDLL